MRKKIWSFVIIVIVLVVTLSSCTLPDPSVPDFVWEGFECSTFDVNGVQYIRIIGLKSDMLLGDNFVFPTEINGCEVRSIGRGKAYLLDGKSYSEYFNRSFDGVRKIFLPIRNVTLWQKIKSANAPLKIISLDGKDLPGNLEDHHVFVPFDRYRKYRLSNESNQYKANISFKYNYEDGNEEPNFGYYWIDDLDEGEKLIVIPNDPQREGYSFEGWYTETDCINTVNFEAFTKGNIEEETIFYAKWKVAVH